MSNSFLTVVLHFFSSAPVTSHHATTPLCTALQHRPRGHPRPRCGEYVLNIRLVLFLCSVDTMHVSRVTAMSGVDEGNVKNHMT